MRCWEALADGLLDAAILARLEGNRPDPATRSADWIARQHQKIHAALAAMARGLGEQPFCCDNKYSLADIALGCALGYLDFRFPQIDWRSQYPNLDRHAARLMARPAFVETAPPKA